MKKVFNFLTIIMLLLCMLMLGSCNSKEAVTYTKARTTPITKTATPTEKTEVVEFDKNGVNINEITELLSGYGKVKWDYEKEGYVLQLEDIGYNNVLKSVKYLMDNPTWSYGKKWWESFKEGLKNTTKLYNCCIYVADPNNTNYSILKVSSGEVVFDYM